MSELSRSRRCLCCNERQLTPKRMLGMFLCNDGDTVHHPYLKVGRLKTHGTARLHWRRDVR